MDQTHASLGRCLTRAGNDLGTLVGLLGQGRLAPDDFVLGLFDRLLEAHQEAAYLGRYRAGDRSLPDADDRGFAWEVMRGEDEFLARFAQDIESGRYTDAEGKLLLPAIRARTALYLQRVIGTANEAWVLASPGVIEWRLSPAEHCDDCLELAARSPYLPMELPAVPRDGSTQCLSSCKCVLHRPDGETSFSY